MCGCEEEKPECQKCKNDIAFYVRKEQSFNPEEREEAKRALARALKHMGNGNCPSCWQYYIRERQKYGLE